MKTKFYYKSKYDNYDKIEVILIKYYQNEIDLETMEGYLKKETPNHQKIIFKVKKKKKELMNELKSDIGEFLFGIFLLGIGFYGFILYSNFNLRQISNYPASVVAITALFSMMLMGILIIIFSLRSMNYNLLKNSIKRAVN